MAYTVLSEVQTQEEDLDGTMIDVMEIIFTSPEGWRGTVRVQLQDGWQDQAVGYIDQRVTEMQAVAPDAATVAQMYQTQEDSPSGMLVDVMNVTFTTNAEKFIGNVEVPIAEGWNDVATQQINDLTVQMQAVVLGGE